MTCRWQVQRQVQRLCSSSGWLAPVAEASLPCHPSSSHRGNHDNYVECGNPEGSPSHLFTAQLYRSFFGARPYASVDLGRRWKVIALNSMQGYTWDAAEGRCNPL